MSASARSAKKVRRLPVKSDKLVAAFRDSLEHGGYVDAAKYELAAVVALDTHKPDDARVLAQLAQLAVLKDICKELEVLNADESAPAYSYKED